MEYRQALTEFFKQLTTETWDNLGLGDKFEWRDDIEWDIANPSVEMFNEPPFGGIANYRERIPNYPQPFTIAGDVSFDLFICAGRSDELNGVFKIFYDLFKVKYQSWLKSSEPIRHPFSEPLASYIQGGMLEFFLHDSETEAIEAEYDNNAIRITVTARILLLTDMGLTNA